MHRPVSKFAVPVVAAYLIAGGMAGPPAETAAAATSPPSGSPTTLTAQPSHFDGSVRSLPRVGPSKHRELPEPRQPQPTKAGPSAQPSPPAPTQPLATAPAPFQTFPGLDFANWGAGWPPDTNGDVGPTYYIQTVNTSIGIFRKSDGARVAAFTFNAFFGAAPTGTPCDAHNGGDPVVLYDSLADRWLITDFAWANLTQGPFYQCMAVSRTGDPVNGGWNIYPWQVEPFANTNGNFPDYPKLGIWPDAVYMSANIFRADPPGSYKFPQVWAFNRAEMESGVTAHAQSLTLTSLYFSLLPANARLQAGLPPSGSVNYFLAESLSAFQWQVWKYHVDWNNSANSTFAGPTLVSQDSYTCCPGAVAAEGGNNLATLSDRVMMQNQYQNRAGMESLWTAHTVGKSSTTTDLQWAQLTVTGGAIAPSPAQQAFWNPDANNKYMPSIAVDKNGDAAVGYTSSSSTQFAGIYYAGRLVTDAVNTLGQTEQTLFAGSGGQSGNCGPSACTRWGDYSAMTLDVDGCTFWYTNEYYAASGLNWQTRIGDFRYSSCTQSAFPALAINDVSQAEGNSGTTNFNFTVSLSPASTQTVTVKYATSNGTATAPSDYATTSGTLTFNSGDASKTITVPVNGDNVFEPDETFTVNLSGASGASVSQGTGIGTIQNDDASCPGYQTDPRTQIAGTSGNDTLIGTAGDDVICGLDGNDTLRGLGGNDLLLGGNGNDSLYGGAGNDTFDGGPGSDQAVFAESPVASAVTADLSGAASVCSGVPCADNVQLGHDTFVTAAGCSTTEVLVGTRFNDVFTGDSCANGLYGFKGDDTLTGGAGNDLLQGGDGADTMRGGLDDDALLPGAGDDPVVDGQDGNDTVSYSDITSGGVNIDVPSATVTPLASGNAGTDSISNMEVYIGTPQNDTLTGGPNNDLLYGIEGNDAISGGGGNDLIGPGAGNDTVDGGTGQDGVDYFFSSSGTTVNLASETASDGLGGTDSLASIENVIGSVTGGDMVTGSDASNAMWGLGGDDTLLGGLGDDFLDGGANDTASPGDTLNGGPDTDTCLNGETVSNCEATSGPVRSFRSVLKAQKVAVAAFRKLGLGSGLRPIWTLAKEESLVPAPRSAARFDA